MKCLALLVTYGWGSKLSPELAQQILSLLVFIIDGVPGSDQKRKAPEETVLECYRALEALLDAAGTSSTAAAGLTASQNIPVIGHAVTVMLDGLVDGKTPQIQQAASGCLQAMYKAMRDRQACASFLPGVVSAYAKVLSTPARHKKIVLVSCLDSLRLVLTRVLGDIQVRSILTADTTKSVEKVKDGADILSPSWLKATVAQIKLALATVMKLHTNDGAEVQTSLAKLCVTLLDECHTSLADSTALLVETAMILGSKDVKADGLSQTSLHDLIGIYPELADTVKTTMYSWMASLPRLVESNNESSKRQSLQNLSRGLQLMDSLQIDSSTIRDAVPGVMRDSLVTLISASKQQQPTAETPLLLQNGVLASKQGPSATYQAIILSQESQRDVRREIISLISAIGRSSQEPRILANMMQWLQESTSMSQIAACWICFEMIKANRESSSEVDDFLNLSEYGVEAGDMGDSLRDLFAFSVQTLDSQSELSLTDWRLEALSMEIIAYAAQVSGTCFRPELIDVLFPVATFLGSENTMLQRHAVATLNLIASACEYDSVSELIVQNVDYMVNSVALRLNSLDISPSSTQVLTMMIRLAGPRLIPFLDDVVDSIFAALENYHGYSAFVESLFGALKEAVQQGVRSDALLLEDQKSRKADHKIKAPASSGLEEVIKFLDRRKEQAARAEAEDEDVSEVKGHPKQPWKTLPSVKHEEAEETDQETEQPREPEKPTNSPTYQLIQRIANLTQHYLTSPSPKLRRSLLELLTTASKALSADEDAFLPLVNDIWPVVISRLHDEEAYIAIEACQTLAGLCEAAGDFLRTRFQSEWKNDLCGWCRRVRARAIASGSVAKPRPDHNVASKKIILPFRTGNGRNEHPGAISSGSSSGSLGQHGSPIRIWSGVVKLLTAIVSYVRVDEYMFDDILDLLSDAMEKSSEVRTALETVNADAVWLVRYRKGLCEWKPAPEVHGLNFIEMERPNMSP